MTDLFRTTSSFVTKCIEKAFGIKYRPYYNIISQSYPGLIEFWTSIEPSIRNPDVVIVLRTRDWVLYKVEAGLHIRWWKYELANSAWKSIMSCRALRHCEVDRSLAIALQGWVAFVCCERNKDLASNILLPEYSIFYAVEVFDEFYCAYTDYIDQFYPDHLFISGDNIIEDLVQSYLLPDTDTLTHVIRATPPYLKLHKAGGVILKALLQHFYRQRPVYDKARRMKFLLPALRTAFNGLRAPRTHGLPMKWYELGVLIPTVLTGLYQWESCLDRVKKRIDEPSWLQPPPPDGWSPTGLLSSSPSSTPTGCLQPHSIGATYNRLLNATRWALELAICLCMDGNDPIIRYDVLCSHMTVYGELKVVPTKPLAVTTIIKLAYDEFVSIGGVDGCLEKLPHLLSEAPRPPWYRVYSFLPPPPGRHEDTPPRLIQVDLSQRDIIVQSERDLLNLVSQLYDLDNDARLCWGLAMDGQSGLLRSLDFFERNGSSRT